MNPVVQFIAIFLMPFALGALVLAAMWARHRAFMAGYHAALKAFAHQTAEVKPRVVICYCPQCRARRAAGDWIYP